MDLAHPISSVLPSVTGVVLDVLLSDHRPLTGRMVAKFSDGRASQKAVSVALRKLSDEGLVVHEVTDHGHRFRINEDHLATPALRLLHGMRGALVAALQDLVAGWTVQPAGAWLVGPFVELPGFVRSDLEVLLIPPAAVVDAPVVDAPVVDAPVSDASVAWSRQLGALMERTHAWTGSVCAVTEWTMADLSSPDRTYDGQVALLQRGSVPLVPFDWTTRSPLPAPHLPPGSLV